MHNGGANRPLLLSLRARDWTNLIPSQSLFMVSEMILLKRSATICWNRGRWRIGREFTAATVPNVGTFSSNQAPQTSEDEQKPGRQKVSRRNAGWDRMCKQFQEFVEKHGHGRVPTPYRDNPELGYWAARQRHLYKRKMNGNTNSLTQKQQNILEALGMSWKPYDEAWEQHYSELLKYVKEHGHANVSRKEDFLLRGWVERQRIQYRNLKENKTPFLTEERVELLKKAGLQFEILEDAWLEQYEKLCHFYRHNGHTLVPRTYPDNTFARWVETQRRQYRLFQLKRRSSMKQDRIDLLEKLDFVWFPYEAAWLEKYNELKAYVQDYGLGAAPPRKTYPATRRWLSAQESYYRKKQNGKTVSLTDERVAKLRQLGFLLN